MPMAKRLRGDKKRQDIAILNVKHDVVVPPKGPPAPGEQVVADARSAAPGAPAPAGAPGTGKGDPERFPSWIYGTPEEVAAGDPEGGTSDSSLAEGEEAVREEPLGKEPGAGPDVEAIEAVAGTSPDDAAVLADAAELPVDDQPEAVEPEAVTADATVAAPDDAPEPAAAAEAAASAEPIEAAEPAVATEAAAEGSEAVEPR